MDAVKGDLFSDKIDKKLFTADSPLKIKLISEGIDCISDLADPKIKEYIIKVLEAKLDNEDKANILLFYLLLMAKLS